MPEALDGAARLQGHGQLRIAWVTHCGACAPRRRGRGGPALPRPGAFARLSEEEHVWYQLDLAGERPRRELPEDVRLDRAGDDRLAGAVEMGQRIDEIRARRAAGNDLWLAEDDGGPLFRCWIYRGRAPVLAAPGGWLELPPGTVCLEDSATTPRARGRGIAPGAWTAHRRLAARRGPRRT